MRNLQGRGAASAIRSETFTQADHFLKANQAVANRITVGLVIAALIVGSSLIMRVPTQTLLFGQPAVAVLGFLTASAIGSYVVITALV